MTTLSGGSFPGGSFQWVQIAIQIVEMGEFGWAQKTACEGYIGGATTAAYDRCILGGGNNESLKWVHLGGQQPLLQMGAFRWPCNGCAKKGASNIEGLNRTSRRGVFGRVTLIT